MPYIGVPFEYTDSIEVGIDRDGDEDNEERELKIEIGPVWGNDDPLAVHKP